MTGRKRSTSQGRAHRFGGDWTTTKLDVLAKYLAAYSTALKDKPNKESPFKKAYIDAFAGTGYRTLRQSGPSEQGESLLFPDLAEPAPQQLLDGSARLALQTTPRFDKYIFIEQSQERCLRLEELKQEFPALASDIQIKPGDANEEIRRLCQSPEKWRSRRAVLFLDPYGMQVEWQTIEAIARTKAIDLWLLFPLGMGMNRLLTRSGDIPPSWRHRLDIMLGTQDWYDEFYRIESQQTLFGQEERLVKATMKTMGRYFNDRLKTIFAGVAEHPGVLRNSANCPLYLLCFAVGNMTGARPALNIANYLLKEIR